MEGDNQNNKTKEAEVASAPSNSQPDDGATAAAHNIQTQDFSQPEQGSITKCPGEDEKRVPEALGTAPGVATARSGLGPGFVDISGDVGGSGHNETLVDIIAVPCPGADPVHTWIYDALGGDGNHPPDIGSRSSLRRPTPWVTKDLRSRVDIGRVFLYRHRALQEGMSLKSLSKDLLDQIELMRSGAVGLLAHPRAPAHADDFHRSRGLYFFSPIASAAWWSKRPWCAQAGRTIPRNMSR